MAWAWRAYHKLMSKHPWKVQIVTSGALIGCSDIISQQVIERQGLANHSIKRTIKMTTVGLVYVAPVLGVWYRSLDRLIVGQSKAVAFKKMLLDQFALAPCFLACFFIVTGFLGGHSREEIQLKIQKESWSQNFNPVREASSVYCSVFLFSVWLPLIIVSCFCSLSCKCHQLRHCNFKRELDKYLDYKKTLISNYFIWPAVQMVNFHFVPLAHRLPVVQIVALMWNTYLSWMANKI